MENLELISAESWYEVEVAAQGSDDWYATNEKADTMKALKEKLMRGRPFHAGFDTRYVKKTLTVEVVYGRNN